MKSMAYNRILAFVEEIIFDIRSKFWNIHYV